MKSIYSIFFPFTGEMRYQIKREINPFGHWFRFSRDVKNRSGLFHPGNTGTSRIKRRAVHSDSALSIDFSSELAQSNREAHPNRVNRIKNYPAVAEEVISLPINRLKFVAESQRVRGKSILFLCPIQLR